MVRQAHARGTVPDPRIAPLPGQREGLPAKRGPVGRMPEDPALFPRIQGRRKTVGSLVCIEAPLFMKFKKTEEQQAPCVRQSP